MAKLTDKQKKKIIADYIETNNYSEAGRLNNVSDKTVKRIIDAQDNNDMVEKVEQKKQENTQSTIEYMQTQHETKKRILDKVKIPIISICEDVDKHYKYWEDNVNPNKEDCCNLRR